jgi:hypothetical protein
LWSAGIAAAVGLVCYAAAASVGTTLFAGGTAFGIALWTGIAADRFRGPLSRIVNPLSRTAVPWLVLCGSLLAIAAFLAVAVAAGGVSWLPAESGPFGL